MKMADFTKTELDVLIEAVDSWVNKDMGTNIICDIMGMMFSDNTPESKAKAEAEKAERTAKTDIERTARKERAIMLNAKLLKVRDGIEAASV